MTVETLEWLDGFRYGGLALRYDFVGSGCAVASGIGVDNGVDDYGFSAGFASGSVIYKNVSATATKVSGVHYRIPSTNTDVDREMMRFRAGTTTHLSLWVSPTTFLVQVKRGDGTLLGTSPSPVASAVGDICYLEMKATIDDAAGTVEVRNFGAPIITLSGIDTRNGGSAFVDNVGIGGFSRQDRFDDFYIDTTNFRCTTTRTPHIRDLATVGAGSSTDWGSVGASSNWDAVNDGISIDSDASYVASSTVGELDLYALTDFPPGGSIVGVVQWAVARKDDASARTMAFVLKSGASESDGPGKSLTNSYACYARALETDPSTGVAFAPASFQPEIGMKVAA